MIHDLIWAEIAWCSFVLATGIGLHLGVRGADHASINITMVILMMPLVILNYAILAFIGR